MDESIRDPREDISLIKHMLEKTTAGMKAVAPWFTGFGVVWLVYGGLSAIGHVLLAASPTNNSAVLGAYALVSSALGWLFYGVLAGCFVLCRRSLGRRGLTAMALRLLDMWGVCIYMFLGLSVVLSLIPGAAVRLLGANIGQVSGIAQIGAYIRSSLFFLLPALPLLMTALFLENRRMLRMGIALAVLTALFLGFSILGSNTLVADVSMALVLLSVVIAVLLDIAPGVMLLIFGRQLKRM